jgi:ribosome silencing factor RsfS/YbeB/iojap
LKHLPSLVATAARAALEKKAEAALALDLRPVADFADFFLLLTGHNQRQLVAIVDAVMDALRAQGRRPAHVEGYPRHEWILLDYGSFVVHVMTPKSRAFYDLERLWGGSKRVEVTG